MIKNQVIIEDIGEYAYCLYTNKMENNECPVIAWNRHGGLDDFNKQGNFMNFYHKDYWMQKKHGKKNFKIDSWNHLINGINKN